MNPPPTTARPSRARPTGRPNGDPSRDPASPKPGWSEARRKMFMAACTAAGIDDAHRYLIMRHCGCPIDPRTQQPSVRHPRNRAEHLPMCMAIVEGLCAQRGVACPRPSSWLVPKAPRGRAPRPASGPVQPRSWSDAVSDSSSRQRDLIAAMARECSQRLPALFREGFLSGFIARQTRGDDALHPGLGGRTELADLDAGQLYRVHEGLKAWASREFARAGLTPRLWRIPTSVLSQFEARPG